MVDVFDNPDFTSDSAAQYKANIDNAFAVHNPTAGAFHCYENDTPNMTVKVSAGVLNLGTKTTSVTAQTSGTITAPSVNPRIDVVYIDADDGTIGVTTGTEAASPSAPAITGNKIPLAQITLATSTTTITNSLITDVRNSVTPVTQASAGTQTVGSAVASVDFLLDEDYEVHEIEFINLSAATDSVTLNLRISDDSNSTFESGATDYRWALQALASNNTTESTGASDNRADSSDSEIQVSAVIDVADGDTDTVNGKITIYSAADSSQYTSVMWQLTYVSETSGMVTVTGSGQYKTTGTVNGCQLFMSSGNIDAGKFALRQRSL